MAKFDMRGFLAEMTSAQSPADKEFEALQPVVKKDHPVATEVQFKGGTKKDNSKMAHPSNATGMEDDVNAEKPLGEEEKLEEARFDHRDAGAAGVIHSDSAKHYKVGEHSDFYDHKTGDKVQGKVLSNDGKSISIGHEGKTKKFKVASSYPGLAEHVEYLEDISEENLQEISKKVLGSYIAKAALDIHGKGHERSSLRTGVNHSRDTGDHAKARDLEAKDDKVADKSLNRAIGIGRASRKLTKEEVSALVADALKEHKGE